MYIDYQELAESKLVQSCVVILALVLITTAFLFAGASWLDEPRVYRNADGVVRCEIVVDGELKVYDASWYRQNQDNYPFVEYWVE